MKVIIISPRDNKIREFSQELKKILIKASLDLISDFPDALQEISEAKTDLVILDDAKLAQKSKECVIDILGVSAFTNIALISKKSEAELHDEMEGLGLLSVLPHSLKKEDAQTIYNALKKINALS